MNYIKYEARLLITYQAGKNNIYIMNYKKNRTLLPELEVSIVINIIATLFVWQGRGKRNK